MKRHHKIISVFVGSLVIVFTTISCNDTTYVQGQRIYNFWCANCHMEDGSGLVKVNPPVADSDYLRDNQALIPCMIREGINDTMIVNGVVYHHEMIAHPQLSEIEITNVINYMNHAWGNDYGERNILQIREWLEGCPLPY